MIDLAPHLDPTTTAVITLEVQENLLRPETAMIPGLAAHAHAIGLVERLAGLFAVYVALAGVLPPADDEIYYWCWAQNLQLSYFDHPPMTALLVKASIAVFGDSLTAVRLPACVATVVVLAVLGWLTRPRHLLAWVACTPLFTYGGVLLTPDTPLLLFWALYLAWLTVVHQRLTPMTSDATGWPMLVEQAVERLAITRP